MMKKTIMIRRLACCLVVLLCCCAVTAKSQKPAGEAAWLPEFHAEFRNFFIYQLDTDFDDTDPLYDENGQSMGYVSTLIRPTITWTPHSAITLFYELEIGDNIWSRNDANQGDATGEGSPVFRHRQFWASVRMLVLPVTLKAGYSYFHDPTHLVADRYVGMGSFTYEWEKGHASFGAAVIPDTTYEGDDPNQNAFGEDTDGYDPSRNNFENDDFFFFIMMKQELAAGLTLEPGIYLRWDKTIIDRERTLASPVINLTWEQSALLAIQLDLAGQIGNYENGGIGGRDLDILAGAAQLRFDFDLELVAFRLGCLAFTPDKDLYDLEENGFDYSGFSKSRTVLLSENWLQDQYTNLDERAAAQKAGLVLGDMTLEVQFITGVSAFFTAGYGQVLEDKNLSDGKELGWEMNGGFTWDVYRDLASLTLMGAGLLPGEAAAALTNEIDRNATENLWNVQASMDISF